MIALERIFNCFNSIQLLGGTSVLGIILSLTEILTPSLIWVTRLFGFVKPLGSLGVPCPFPEASSFPVICTQLPKYHQTDFFSIFSHVLPIYCTESWWLSPYSWLLRADCDCLYSFPTAQQFWRHAKLKATVLVRTPKTFSFRATSISDPAYLGMLTELL